MGIWLSYLLIGRPDTSSFNSHFRFSYQVLESMLWMNCWATSKIKNFIFVFLTLISTRTPAEFVSLNNIIRKFDAFL